MTDLATGTTRYAGSSVARREDPRLLTGRGTFVDDIVRPGMLHACFVRSPHARARVVRIDIGEALALPGVHAVFTAADLNAGAHPVWFTTESRSAPGTPLLPLADGEVRFVGDPVALVVAESRYVAEDACDLVLVDYEPLPALADYELADGAAESVHDAYPGNVAGTMAGGRHEDAERAIASAPHVVEHTIRQQACAAAPMETRGIVCEWDPACGEMTIWAATQAPHEVRSVCARLLGIPESRIRVIMRDTGGGFGQKVVPLREELCVMLAARRVPAAVKWIEDRRENLMAAGQARHEHARVRMAFDGEGRFLAATIDHVQDVGAYPVPWPVGPGAAVGMLFPGPYRIPVTAFTHRSVFSNTAGRTAYRGPWAFESVAREVTLDIAARRLGMDPAELRRRNMLRAGDLPYVNGNGMPYSHMSPLETFERALELIGYAEFRRRQAAGRVAGRYLGVGTCTYVEPTTPGYGHYGSEGATIRIEPDGTVTVCTSGGSTGNSLETTVAQLAADALGVAIDDVRTVQGDTGHAPYGAGTGGSRSGAMTAGAVAAAAAVVRARVAAVAAHLLEAAVEDIDVAGGRAFVRGAPAKGISLADVAEVAYFRPEALPPGLGAGLEATERYTTPSPLPIWANATHACTCEVDPDTGAVTIERYVVVEDCGPMINPAVVAGQIAGGTVQGIGGAILEELAYDADGNPLATTFMDYLVPTACDVPLIEQDHIVTPGPGPGGYKGVGEGGAIGAPPAVINAVADALAPLGVVVDRLPLSPATVVDLIERATRT